MFYKIEIQTLKDGSTAVVPTATFEDDKSAEIAFHQAVAYNMSAETLNSFLVMVISEVGTTLLKKFYNFAVEPEPEPEPEEE